MAQLAHWARHHPERIAAHFPELGATVSYGALADRANRAAQWLIGLGLQPGEGIALLLDNRPEFLELAQATRDAGLYYTPLSIHLRPPEVAHVLRDSGAKLLVVSDSLAALAAALRGEGATGGLPCYALGEGLPGHESYERALAALPGTGDAARTPARPRLPLFLRHHRPAQGHPPRR